MFRLDERPDGFKIKYKGVLYCTTLPFLSFLLVHQGQIFKNLSPVEERRDYFIFSNTGLDISVVAPEIFNYF